GRLPQLEGHRVPDARRRRAPAHLLPQPLPPRAGRCRPPRGRHHPAVDGLHRLGADGRGGDVGRWERRAQVSTICLRRRATGTFSCSRYFVTVRRAIWNPRSSSMSAMAWSESGLVLYSSAMIRSMMALTSLFETSSPESVERPSEKKYFSS